MKGYIVLENGDIFQGDLHGKTDDVHGEIVFYTGMTGYQEVLSDPSMKGQIVVFTYPLIGSCGVNEAGFESSKLHVNGVIVSEVSEEGFHYESGISLPAYCHNQSVPILSGIDTRAIVKRIRKYGDMKAVLTTDPNKVNFNQIPLLEDQDVVQKVSQSKMKTIGSGEHHIVMVDFGFKKSILESILKQGCKVTVVPHTTTFHEIEKLRPTGILFTNGPGHPLQLQSQLVTIKKLAIAYPTLGIGLGHQLLALAFGAEVEKLSFGHRGTNEPVIDKQTNKIYMTAQNHSYIVNEQSLEKTGFEARFVNVNDKTIEGLSHTKYEIMTTQFHPVAYPGPSDSEQLFYSFIDMLRKRGREKAYA